MLGLIKKSLRLFRPVVQIRPETKEDSKENALSKRLKVLANNEERLIILFNDPVHKLYLLNTYSSSLDDLLRNIANKDFNRKINAVNCHSYFKNSIDKLTLSFTRIADMLDNGHRLPSMIEHDIYEIIDAYDYFDFQ